MAPWPDYITRTLDTLLCHAPGEAEELIEGLTRRWGGLDPDTLMHMLREGKEEHVFALLALGYAGTSQAAEYMLPFLDSPHKLERWASARGLGRLRDERALPALLTMLTEFQPADPPSKDAFYYNEWPGSVPGILGAWGRRDAVPALRQALQWTLDHAPRAAGGAPGTENGSTAAPLLGKWDAERAAWERYQEEIVYALGRLHAFGALTALTQAEARLDSWRVHLVLGALHAQVPMPDAVARWKHVPELEAAVRRLLGERFGATVAEQDALLQQRYGLLPGNVVRTYREAQQQALRS